MKTFSDVLHKTPLNYCKHIKHAFMKEKLLCLSELRPKVYCLYTIWKRVYVICLVEQSVNSDPQENSLDCSRQSACHKDKFALYQILISCHDPLLLQIIDL